MSNESDVIFEYFKDKSDVYDLENQRSYWRLCDTLLWELLCETLSSVNFPFCFIDAGGGTGDWTKRVLEKYILSSGIICDFSPYMLNKAKPKLAPFIDRIELIEANLSAIPCKSSIFDVVFSFYVLPFMDDSNSLIRELSRVTKKNGYIICVAENYYNGLALNLLTGNAERINNLYYHKSEKISVRTPKLRFHTEKDLYNLYVENGIKVDYILGFPVVSTIGVKENISLNNYEISSALSDPQIYNQIIDIERALIREECTVTRGKYLYIVGKKL